MLRLIVIAAYISVGLNPLNMGALTTQQPVLDIEFSQQSTLEIGAPVVLSGKAIGKVVSVNLQSTSSKKGFSATVAIESVHRGLVREGTFALITSPLPAYDKPRENVVELFVPKQESAPALKDGKKLKGFASFKEFWTAPSAS